VKPGRWPGFFLELLDDKQLKLPDPHLEGLLKRCVLDVFLRWRVDNQSAILRVRAQSQIYARIKEIRTTARLSAGR
jgi:hypothetical protein